jgi:RHS repeat-associated protein
MADFTIAQMYDQYDRVTEGKKRITYGYHVDGQLATVTKGKVTENFIWDGLALVKRGTTSYVNEPHPGGGAPVASSNSGVMFNDILGTTLGVSANDGYASSSMTAFGDTAKHFEEIFFTGKPHVDGLGHAFILRNYRADLGKWPTADPLGYPDGWNQMTYCRNEVSVMIDRYGASAHNLTEKHFVDLIDSFEGEMLYIGAWLHCWCNDDYYSPSLKPFWGEEQFDFPSMIEYNRYDESTGESIKDVAFVSGSFSYAVGQMLVTPSVVGDSKYIEIFVGITLKITIDTSFGSQEIPKLLTKHFGCTVWKPLVE